jgi:hypothetical protein
MCSGAGSIRLRLEMEKDNAVKRIGRSPMGAWAISTLAWSGHVKTSISAAEFLRGYSTC